MYSTCIISVSGIWFSFNFLSIVLRVEWLLSLCSSSCIPAFLHIVFHQVVDCIFAHRLWCEPVFGISVMINAKVKWRVRVTSFWWALFCELLVCRYWITLYIRTWPHSGFSPDLVLVCRSVYSRNSTPAESFLRFMSPQHRSRFSRQPS